MGVLCPDPLLHGAGKLFHDGFHLGSMFFHRSKKPELSTSSLEIVLGSFYFEVDIAL